MYAYLPFSILLRDWTQAKFTRQQVNIQHSEVLCFHKTEINPLIYMFENRSAITFAQGCNIVDR